VDGFLTELLGPFFFILILVIYSLVNLLLFTKKRRLVVPVLMIGLVIYYLAGIPAYYKGLMDYQTYPWLAKQISQSLPPTDLKNPETVRISVFLPEERDEKSEAEIYNGLRVRGIDNTQVYEYNPENLANMTTDQGFIIQIVQEGTEATSGQDLYQFNGKNFTIQQAER